MAFQFATRLSLLAFAAMLADGFLCGTDFSGAMQGAFAAAVVCLAVGYASGEMARRLVQEMAAREVQQMAAQQVTPPAEK